MSTAFLTSSKPVTKSEHLIGMKHDQGESLLSFWKSFNAKVIKISNLNHDIDYAALMSGINDKNLIFDLSLRPPSDWNDLVSRNISVLPAEENLNKSRVVPEQKSIRNE